MGFQQKMIQLELRLCFVCINGLKHVMFIEGTPTSLHELSHVTQDGLKSYYV